MIRVSGLVLVLTAGRLAAARLRSSPDPLRIEITEGVIEPLPFAAPAFHSRKRCGRSSWRCDITRVIAADLVGTGLFREIPQAGVHFEHHQFFQPGAVFRLEGDQCAGADHRRGERRV